MRAQAGRARAPRRRQRLKPRRQRLSPTARNLQISPQVSAANAGLRCSTAAARGYLAPMRIRIGRGLALFTIGALTSTVAVVLVAANASAAGEPYRDPSLPVATRVADLLGRMSLDEKLGQMTQAERASITAGAGHPVPARLGAVRRWLGPVAQQRRRLGEHVSTASRTARWPPRWQIPIIYGVDAVHGHNNVVGATIFPHNIGLGATRDPALVQRHRPGHRRGGHRHRRRLELRALPVRGPQRPLGPHVRVVRREARDRLVDEHHRHRPAGRRAWAAPASVLATAKHYVGDGGTTNGTDQGNAQISEAELRAIHLPPFQAAIQRGVGSVMISFSSWNGAEAARPPVPASPPCSRASWASPASWSPTGTASTRSTAPPACRATEVRTAVNAGIDMVMVPTAVAELHQPAAHRGAGRPGARWRRIDDANRRILTKKFELGLFERPLADRTLRVHGGQCRAP